MNDTYLLALADAFAGTGLGHLSRSSAVVNALRLRGVTVRCLALTAESPREFDGVSWEPADVATARAAAAEAPTILLDTYTVRLDRVGGPVAAFYDPGALFPEAASLLIAQGVRPSEQPTWLCGLRHACVRPGFWGTPPVTVTDTVRRVVVTTGGTDPGDISEVLAAAAHTALPLAEVRRIRGPQAAYAAVSGVTEVHAPVDLRLELAAADLVICLAGQTAFEACSLGVPVVAVAPVENQQANLERLVEAGAIEAAELGGGLVGLLADVAADPSRRRQRAAAARAAVDGFGSLRVAGEIEARFRLAV
jgi:spore coat polysaccharide biosynthesis predicted glycosyltransferase SpsG